MYKKESLLRYTGSLQQIAGIRTYECNNGMAKGITTTEVRTGSGLVLSVLENKNMDVYHLEYKGINFAFYYKNGLVSPERFLPIENEFLAYAGGGMMYTTGLQNSGPANTEGGLYQPLHGRIHSMSADNICRRADYDKDGTFRINVSGRSRESRLFGHNLTLNRSISTELYAKDFYIEDTIENETCRESFFSLMYHFNFGYPFLDEGVKVVLSKNTQTTARSEHSQKFFDERFEMTAPIDNFEEHLYYHNIPADANGLSYVLVYNPKLSLAVRLSFNKKALPYLGEWKSMGSGDYALGILPANNLLRGRNEEKEKGVLPLIAAFASQKVRLHFEILDSQEDINAAIKEIENI